MAESVHVAAQWNKHPREQTSQMVFLSFLETWKGWCWWTYYLSVSNEPTSVFDGWMIWDSWRILGSNVCLLLWFTVTYCADVLWMGLSYSGGWRHTFRDLYIPSQRFLDEVRTQMSQRWCLCVIQAHPKFGTGMVFCFAVQIFKIMVSVKKSSSDLTGFVDYNPTTDRNHIWQESLCYHFVSCLWSPQIAMLSSTIPFYILV